MTEQVSYLESYQGMSPHERDREMKGLFSLLPDFDSTIEDLSLLTKEELNERIRAHNNYRLRNNFIGQVKDLLSFTEITESFKSYILDRYTHSFEFGIFVKGSDNLGGVPDNSRERWDKTLFQWDSVEIDGIYGKNARDIEAKAYKAEFRLGLWSKRINDDIERRMGEFEERIGRIENHDPEKLPVLDEEELTVREIQAANYIAKAKEMVSNESAQERIKHWRNEFIELYGDEP